MTDNTLQFKDRMTKKAFESRLIVDLGVDGLAASPYTDSEGNKMTLYYKNGSHVGTWFKGTGWAFKSAYK